jgi:hypothetical protein
MLKGLAPLLIAFLMDYWPYVLGTVGILLLAFVALGVWGKWSDKRKGEKP